MGHLLEQAVAERYMKITGKTVRRSNVHHIHKTKPWLVGNLDRVVVGEKRGLECKTASSFAAKGKFGKLLELWRPQPVKERAVDEDRMPGPRDVKVLKYSKRGGQRPEIKQLRVLGNQRLTSGGQIKRAKPKQKSIKKRQAD